MRGLTKQDLKEMFDLHGPINERQVGAMKRVREKGRELCELILDVCPDCPDQTAAIRKVRMGVMTANAAIVRGG